MAFSPFPGKRQSGYDTLWGSALRIKLTMVPDSCWLTPSTCCSLQWASQLMICSPHSALQSVPVDVRSTIKALRKVTHWFNNQTLMPCMLLPIRILRRTENELTDSIVSVSFKDVSKDCSSWLWTSVSSKESTCIMVSELFHRARVQIKNKRTYFYQLIYNF